MLQVLMYFFFSLQGCREKAQTIPARLNASVLPQLKALENVIEYIFDRNACLLPGYFIVTEIQKAYPDNKNWPHWVCFIIWSAISLINFKCSAITMAKAILFIRPSVCISIRQRSLVTITLLTKATCHRQAGE